MNPNEEDKTIDYMSNDWKNICSRQYRHNTDRVPGFVMGYDQKETDRVVAHLQSLLQSKVLIDIETAKNSLLRAELDDVQGYDEELIRKPARLDVLELSTAIQRVKT